MEICTLCSRKNGQARRKMTVVVITLNHDIHADAVIDCFSNREDIYRIDPTDKPPPLSFNSEDRVIEIDGSKISPEEVSGIYCRYAIECGCPPGAEDPVSRYRREEYLGSLCGLFLHVPQHRWINSPWSESVASGKVYPLTAAARLGIKVPRFIVTNNLVSLDQFLGKAKNGGYVIKPITDAAIAYQNGAFTDMPDFAAFDAPYTKTFIRSEVDDDSVDETPFLIQQKIEKVSEIRCVVIDDVVLATESDFHPGAEVDIRLQPNRQERLVNLPSQLNQKIISLNKFLHLRFCTLDFSVDQAGELWLTDVNPAGNWLWQEQQSGLGIAQGIASALCQKKHVSSFD